MRSEPVNGGLWAYRHGCGRFFRRFRSVSELSWDVEQGPTRVSPSVFSPLLRVYDIHIAWVHFVCAPLCCSHSSTSSHPSIHHLPCSWNTKHSKQDPINKGPRRIKPPTGGPLLLARPRILATNRQIDTCSSTSPRSMRAVGTGAQLFHFPLYLCLILATADH